MKILIASKIDPAAEATLAAGHDVVSVVGASQETIAEAIVDREVLVFRSGVSLEPELLDLAPDLTLLVRGGSGLDNLDMSYVEGRGLRLERVPGPGAQAVAEMTFALMLAVARNVVLGDRLLREGHWAKPHLTGVGLRGKRLGVVGLGSIGSRVAALGSAWDMRPLGCVRDPSEVRSAELAAQGIDLVDLDQTLAEADFLTIHVPLDDETRGLIGASEMGRMRQGSYLVNIARGGVVDEQALLDVLEAGGPVVGAALDVHVAEGEGKVSPLASLPNVVLTPHIGAGTVDAQSEIGREIVRIVEAYANTVRPSVPLPQGVTG
jgi:D-3-phosphoglycerate dehydrogenase